MERTEKQDRPIGTWCARVAYIGRPRSRTAQWVARSFSSMSNTPWAGRRRHHRWSWGEPEVPPPAALTLMLSKWLPQCSSPSSEPLPC